MKKQIILAVDDNQMNLMVMKSMFKHEEYEVHYADCGQKALDMAREINPDMILLDVVMPDIYGFEVCSILKAEEHFKDIPVIFITAAEEIEYIINGFEAGGVDYITKPFRKEELMVRIKTHFELKLTRDQLLETTKSLHELTRVKERLFSIIGHDLRSPIGNVKMVLEFMSKGIIDPTNGDLYKKTVSDLLRTTDEVFVLLENLLAWSMAESGKQKINPENIRLKEAVLSTVNLYQAGISGKNIRLNINIDAAHIVNADMNILKTIVRNLLSNAIKYTPMDGKINFDSWIENESVTIGIADSGKGMSQDVIEKVMNPHIYFSRTGLNNESGNGLGLKLCKDFVQKSAGELWIDSSPEMGTTVFFTLPQAKEITASDDSKKLVW